MEYKSKYTHQEILKNLSPEELKGIEERVYADVTRIWSSEKTYAPLTFDYCTACPERRGLKHKTRCLCNALTMETICASCWARKREDELIKEAIEAKRPKLDIADFARL